jgi:lipopolysaccharide transport system ATP-binding protein
MSSSGLAISVRGVGKKYTIRHDYTAPTTLGEAITRRVRRPFARARREQFWALKDVTFDVARGEVLGVIGSNGAGKSTLLKILSRITEMSEGEVDLYGRVGSLLEVGTGFNQELTGRENVFLNGAILGMTRSEIRGQFDAIVAFAGVERFLDTPVKHYSSGMYVRLAFAVAAHLRSEILIVDEVLAVGDMDFQRKCLGKMRDVATDGRTVLLVSHNMAAIGNLCSRAVLLRGGRVAFAGDVADAIDGYSAHEESMLVGDLRDRHDRTGRGEIRAESISICGVDGELTRSIRYGEAFDIVIDYDAQRPLEDVLISVSLNMLDGTRIATLSSGFRNESFAVSRGSGSFACRLPGLPLRPDTYSIDVFIHSEHAFHDYVERAMTFDIAPRDVYGTGRMPQRSEGALIADYHWRALEHAELSSR